MERAIIGSSAGEGPGERWLPANKEAVLKAVRLRTLNAYGRELPSTRIGKTICLFHNPVGTVIYGFAVGSIVDHGKATHFMLAPGCVLKTQLRQHVYQCMFLSCRNLVKMCFLTSRDGSGSPYVRRLSDLIPTVKSIEYLATWREVETAFNSGVEMVKEHYKVVGGEGNKLEKNSSGGSSSYGKGNGARSASKRQSNSEEEPGKGAGARADSEPPRAQTASDTEVEIDEGEDTEDDDDLVLCDSDVELARNARAVERAAAAVAGSGSTVGERDASVRSGRRARFREDSTAASNTTEARVSSSEGATSSQANGDSLSHGANDDGSSASAFGSSTATPTETAAERLRQQQQRAALRVRLGGVNLSAMRHVNGGGEGGGSSHSSSSSVVTVLKREESGIGSPSRTFEGQNGNHRGGGSADPGANSTPLNGQAEKKEEVVKEEALEATAGRVNVVPESSSNGSSGASSSAGSGGGSSARKRPAAAAQIPESTHPAQRARTNDKEKEFSCSVWNLSADRRLYDNNRSGGGGGGGGGGSSNGKRRYGAAAAYWTPESASLAQPKRSRFGLTESEWLERPRMAAPKQQRDSGRPTSSPKVGSCFYWLGGDVGAKSTPAAAAAAAAAPAPAAAQRRASSEHSVGRNPVTAAATVSPLPAAAAANASGEGAAATAAAAAAAAAATPASAAAAAAIPAAAAAAPAAAAAAALAAGDAATAAAAAALADNLTEDSVSLFERLCDSTLPKAREQLEKLRRQEQRDADAIAFQEKVVEGLQRKIAALLGI